MIRVSVTLNPTYTGSHCGRHRRFSNEYSGEGLENRHVEPLSKDEPLFSPFLCLLNSESSTHDRIGVILFVVLLGISRTEIRDRGLVVNMWLGPGLLLNDWTSLSVFGPI